MPSNLTMPHTIYDAHMHIYADDPDEAARILDACEIEKAVIMNKGYGKDLPNREYRMWEEAGFRILEKYPERFAVFTTVNFGEMEVEDFPERAAKQLEENVARGASGLKLWLGKPDHHWMSLHDPRIGAVYEKAAELEVPVLIHVGDPKEYWEEITPDSFWYAILGENPQWSFRNKPVASREQLFEEQRVMLQMYPDTTFICPHMGGHAENLPYLGELLDQFPNLQVDTTAYEPVLGQNPESARAFFVKYQDRIMVGTDNGWKAEGMETFRKRMKAVRLFYETGMEQTELGEFLPRRPGYTIRGIHLPAPVLHKIYRRNVLKLVPSLQARQGAR
jgi:predicted TIM-barrel fold metal-dependent hydrolase